MDRMSVGASNSRARAVNSGNIRCRGVAQGDRRSSRTIPTVGPIVVHLLHDADDCTGIVYARDMGRKKAADKGHDWRAGVDGRER